MGKKWQFLTGDVNWRDYGGKWYRVVDHSNKVDPKWHAPLNAYHVLEFYNLEEATGDYNKKQGKYLVKVDLIDLGYDAWRDRIPDALKTSGTSTGNLMKMTMQQRELHILEAMTYYSGGDRVYNTIGNNARKVMSAAMARG
jgi:hypothetical protein